VYVVRRGHIYKVGFTRHRLKRRVRACDGVLVLTIPTKQHVSALERAIHQRFKDKRAEGPGFKEEWFALDDADIHWLSGLAAHLDHNPLYAQLASPDPPNAQAVVS
jgi:hypothetical protein